MAKDATYKLGTMLRVIILAVLFGLSGTLAQAQCPVTVTPPSGAVSCNGAPIQLTASGGSNYFWYVGTPDGTPEGSGSTFIATASGTIFSAGGAVSGWGSAALASGWNADAMMNGTIIGGISGAVGGGFGSALGGDAGAFVGGTASDAVDQLLSTGDLDLKQSLIAGGISFGMYHLMTRMNYNLEGKKFGDIELTYKEFKIIQAEYQRSRFWHKEHDVMLFRNGDPIVAKRAWLSKDGVDWPSYQELGVEVDNIKAQWHSHWSRTHSLGLSTTDLTNPFNQMNTNRFFSNV